MQLKRNLFIHFASYKEKIIMNRQFLTICLAVFFSACSNEKLEFPQLEEPNVEVWEMTAQHMVFNTIFPEPGEVLWKFNYDTNMLQISSTSENVVHNPGQYSFEIYNDSLFIDIEILYFDKMKLVLDGNERLLGADPMPNAFDDDLVLIFDVLE